MSTKPKCVLFCRPICDISRQIDFHVSFSWKIEKKIKTKRSPTKIILGFPSTKDFPGISPYSISGKKNKLFQLCLSCKAIILPLLLAPIGALIVMKCYYISAAAGHFFHIFTQPMMQLMLQVSPITLSRLSSINATDVARVIQFT